jgi:hypothetical protein
MKTLKKASWFYIVVSTLLLVVGGGCDNPFEKEIIQENLRNSVEKRILTQSEKEKLENLKKSTSLLLDLIEESPEVVDLIDFGVSLKYEGDESVLFEEVISPKSELNRLARIQNSKNLSTQKTTPFTSSRLLSLQDLEKIEIYFPYSEQNFDSKFLTVTYNPLDNDDENIGYKLEKVGEKYIFRDSVLVTDDYAFHNPVLILDYHDFLKDIDPNSRKYVDAGVDNAFVNVACCSRVPLTGNNHVNKLFVRHIQLTENFRGLFGKSNKTVFKTTNELTASNSKSINEIHIIVSRHDARKKVWLQVNSVLDENWGPNQLEKFFIAETIISDKTISTEINASIKFATKVKVDEKGVALELGPEFSVGAKFTINRNNEYSYIVRNRRQFFFENWANADSKGTYEGNAIRHMQFKRREGSVNYTLGVVGYNYN